MAKYQPEGLDPGNLIDQGRNAGNKAGKKGIVFRFSSLSRFQMNTRRDSVVRKWSRHSIDTDRLSCNLLTWENPGQTQRSLVLDYCANILRPPFRTSLRQNGCLIRIGDSHLALNKLFIVNHLTNIQSRVIIISLSDAYADRAPPFRFFPKRNALSRRKTQTRITPLDSHSCTSFTCNSFRIKFLRKNRGGGPSPRPFASSEVRCLISQIRGRP